ncbi:MAG: type II toxin-antitoxin system HicA family toxin [Nitrososphaerota archaeon]
MPRLSAREVAKRLHKLCFKKERQKGSHLTLGRSTGEKVTVPVHGDRELSRGVVKQIINLLEDRFNYTRSEAIEFLRTGIPSKVDCPLDS